MEDRDPGNRRGPASPDRPARSPRRPGAPARPPSLPFTATASRAGAAQPDGAAATVEGVIDRVVFSNEETGWSVVRIIRGEDAGGAERTFTAVGSLPGLQPGESIRATGRWETDRKFGRQFRIESHVTIDPATLAGMEKYLGSGLVPGIGPAMARRLVERFGLETLEVIDTHAERLAEVEGIGPVRSRRIRSAWAGQRAVKQVMLFLHTHALSPGQAARIFRHYGDRAEALIRDNPYRLAEEIAGIGFLTADRIASRLGVPPSSKLRAQAGVLHVLAEQSEEGHVFLPRDRLVDRSVDLLAATPRRDARDAPADIAELVGGAVEDLERRGKIAIDGDGAAQAVYLAPLFAAETGSAERLATLLTTPPAPVKIDVERAIAWYEAGQRIDLAPEQREALRRALESKVLVITGGPGTGKTTIVNGIIRILEKKRRRILLCAPTGRAARRLAETTGRDARTIHRLLEFTPRTMAFARGPGRPLEADLLVVDEMSMVDIPLFHHLLRAVPAACRLVLVGDVDQLPSVGPGSVLADLIRSDRVEVVRLREIFRQARESLIVVNAHRVNHGEMPRLDPTPGGADLEGTGASDFFLVERTEPEEILSTIRSLVADRIPRRFGLDPVDDVQVLSPMQRGPLGAANLNAELQALLNPAPGGRQAGGEGSPAPRGLREGDKVMQMRNNYGLEVFNGDIGRIVRASPGAVPRDPDGPEGTDPPLLLVRFDGRTVGYRRNEADELVLAYACSVHKSQGSEYPAVVLPLHTQHYVMLQRNLLYTALTRGKRLVVIVGSRRALAAAVKNDRIRERSAKLDARLRDLVPARSV